VSFEKLKALGRALTSKRMIVVLLLGFSSGLPIMLVLSTLKIWLRREGFDLSTIGYLSWIGIPYSLNFLMGPILDRYIPTRLGRRRSWILAMQIGIMLSLVGIYLSNPLLNLSTFIYCGIALAFFSATQDVAIDAYRREILPDKELGVGAALGVYGYRTAMLVASGFGLWVVDPETWGFTFNQSFLMMAGFMLVGVVTCFLATEPKLEHGRPQSLHDTMIAPFADLLSRNRAFWILFFIFLFKFGDAMAGSMLGAFYVDVGFSNKVIAEITKGFGFFSSMAGLFIGGGLIYRFGIYPCLWAFGILQSLSTLNFVVLTQTGPDWWTLVYVIAFEDMSSGMGTAALVAYLGKLTNRRFTATQYALLNSLASLGRVFFSGFAGVMASTYGYLHFFIICAAFAIPGLLVLSQISPKKLGSHEEVE
jgi:PAT family beta-lactamase induction signal transducer AmpG